MTSSSKKGSGCSPVQRKRNIGNLICFWVLMLLFPGFFFYQFLIGKGLIAPILGGYFGNMALACAVPLILFNWSRVVVHFDFVSKCFFGVLLMTVSISSWSFFHRMPDGWHVEMLEWSTAGVLFNVVCYLIGRGSIETNFASTALVAFCVMASLVLVGRGDSSVFYLRREAGLGTESLASYQGFARSLAVVALYLTAAFWHHRVIFFPLVIGASFALFYNGARTEFVGFMMSVAMLTVRDAVGSKTRRIRAVSLLLAIGALFVFLVFFIPETRIAQLQEISESSSGLSRLELFQNGLMIIEKNPILGKYGDYVNVRGTGSYPHNIIAAWVNLGFIGFLVYICIYALMWRNQFLKFRAVKDTCEYRFFSLLLIFTTFALLLAKEYTYMLVGLCIGSHARCCELVRLASAGSRSRVKVGTSDVGGSHVSAKYPKVG